MENTRKDIVIRENARGRRTKNVTYADPAMERFASELEKIIDDTKLSQQEFVKKTGVSQSTISKIFSGKYAVKPSIATIKKLARGALLPEEAYKRLMESLEDDNYDVELSPLNEVTTIYDITDSHRNALFDIIHAISKQQAVQNLEDVSIDNTITFSCEGEINTWIIYTKTNTDFKNEFSSQNDFFSFENHSRLYQPFFNNVLFDGAKATTKYSLFYPDVACLQELIDKFDVPTLNTTISVLYYNEKGRIVETTLKTGIDENISRHYKK